MIRIIATIGIIQVLAILVNIIRSKIVAVLLGPEGVGVVSIVDQVVQTASYLSVLSIPLASIKFLSWSHSEGSEAFRRSYLGFLKAVLFLALAGAAVTSSLVIFWPALLGTEISKYRSFILLALMSIPAMVLGGFFTNVLAAAQKIKSAAIAGVMNNMAMTIAAFAGISLAGIFGLYLGNMMVGLLLIGGFLIYLRKVLHLPLYDRTIRIRDELRRSPEIIPFSMMLFLAAITHSFSFLVARYAVLKNMGEAETGLLQAAMTIALSIGMVLNPANGLFLTPFMNRNIPLDEKVRGAAEFQKKLIILLSLVAMPIVLFPQWIVILLFSSLFVPASQFIFLFVIAQCINQLAGVYQALMIGSNDLKSYAVITCLGHLSLGFFSWLLVPFYGISGVAIGSLISGLTTLVATWTRIRLKQGFSVPLRVGTLMAYTLVALFLVGVLSIRFEDRNPTIALLKVGVYLFFALTLFFFMNKEERTSLYGLWDKVKMVASQA